MPESEILFRDSTAFSGKRMHLSVTGSVACYRACDLLRLFIKMGIHVSVSVSAGAAQFVTPMLFEALGAVPVYSEMPAREQGCFAHLEPGQLAMAMMIAPASANMLSKLACGAASDLVSAQALAFDGPLLLAPAMNPRMWAHPAVQANVHTLAQRGCEIITPGSGGTACGDTGQGRLAEVPQLFWAALKALAPQDMAGKKVLITLGPTREYWDAVRFWSNPSSGRMGFCLALSAWLRGAEVHAVCGPTAFEVPHAIKRYSVMSAEEMYAQCDALWDTMDYGLFSAAVADFAPNRSQHIREQKCKKKDVPEEFPILFHKNRDILMTLAARRRSQQKILAFAAETSPNAESLLALAHEKCGRKGADVLAANQVNEADSGFVSPMNRMAVVDAKGREELWPTMSKADVAWRLCSWLLKT